MKRFIKINDFFGGFISYVHEGGKYKIQQNEILEVLDWDQFSLLVRTNPGHELWIAFPYEAYECIYKEV